MKKQFPGLLSHWVTGGNEEKASSLVVALVTGGNDEVIS